MILLIGGDGIGVSLFLFFFFLNPFKASVPEVGGISEKSVA